MVEYNWDKKLCEEYANNLRSMVKFDHKPWAKKIYSNIKKKKNPEKKIIDIATGPGFLLTQLGLLLNKPEMTAHDATLPMLDIAQKEAQKHNLNIKTVNSAAEKVESDNNFFDIVTCKQLLHEAQNPQKVLEEIHRITTSGGQAFIIDFDKNKCKPVAFPVKSFLRILKGKLIANSFWKSYSGALEGYKVGKMMEVAGFKDVFYLRNKYNYMIYGEK